MVIKYEGTIEYQDGETISFEIDEKDRTKFSYTGSFMYEDQNHLIQINAAIITVKDLLKSNSPIKFEMEEKL